MMDLFFWFIFAIGHLGLWCIIFNRVHATKWTRQARKRFEKFVILAVGLPVLYFAYLIVFKQSFNFLQVAQENWLHLGYLCFCFYLGGFLSLRWCYRKFIKKPPSAIETQSQDFIDVQRELGKTVYIGKVATTLGKVPFNQAHCLTLNRKTFGFEKLPDDLDDLKICHLSDLHLTGQISLEYYDRVVEEVNRYQPDIIVVTGDIIDELECLDWIEPVFARLESKYGNYYVLGNHDKRIKDEAMLRGRLEAAGLKRLTGQWEALTIGSSTIQFAGNELPWYQGAEQLEELSPELAESNDTFRILLSHSPDQVLWAEKFKFDLMFAGHNHGGQIAFPLVGPIVAPSKFGVLYASGTFQVNDILMHVSRGLSGDECIRINSPPEVGLFTLKKKSAR